MLDLASAQLATSDCRVICRRFWRLSPGPLYPEGWHLSMDPHVRVHVLPLSKRGKLTLELLY
jgi:hypothetical protein